MSDPHNPYDPPDPAIRPESGPDPTLEDPALRGLARGPGAVRGGHPKGLWVLFITEMWERFSYYGMRALLVLYLIASTSEATENPGFGWENDDAYILYGLYTWAVYLTPIFGGWLADKFLGTHRSMLVGGWIIAAGHITLAATELSGHTVGEVVTMQSNPGAIMTFVAGLALIVIGTGFFKPCVSVMVGQLYEENDPRRDSGFTIFYMGINLGAFLAPLIAGSLGEKVGWHWGFGCAAVGMLAGLVFYQIYRPRYLTGIGDPPEEKGSATTLLLGFLAVAALGLVGWATYTYVYPAVNEYVFWTALIALGIAVIVAFLLMQPAEERSRLGVIFILAFLGNIAFWTAFEQAGSSLNVFAQDNTDRTLWGLLEEGFPATLYQSVNPLTILVFASAFALLWPALERRNMNPSTPAKFAIGLYLLGLAFLAMVFGAMSARDGGLAAPYWLLIFYVVVTWGELCLSPVGLSMVTKLAPPRLQSLMMGFWFFSFSLSNLLAGFVATYSTKIERGEITFVLEGLPGFFLLLVIVPIVVGTLILIISPILRRMMRGVH